MKRWIKRLLDRRMVRALPVIAPLLFLDFFWWCRDIWHVLHHNALL